MRLILSIALFALTSCNPWEDDKEGPPPRLSAAFFAPKKGETLTYRVVQEVISSDQKLPIEAGDTLGTEHIKKVTYDGTTMVGGVLLHRQEITISDKPEGGRFLHWDGETLYLHGTFDNENKPKILDLPLPIATTTMIAGDFWPGHEESDSESGFRILGEEKIKTLAGVVRARKITHLSRKDGTVTIRDYWFTKKIGIVREKNKSTGMDFFAKKSRPN